jgi:hypothetical protein
MRFVRKIGVLVAGIAASAIAAPSAIAASCLVLGEKTAVVRAADGDHSPVFLAPACESLRLVSGKANASWIGKDGKINLVPIGESGPAKVPVAGAEERSGNVVWSELRNTRQAERPGYMRSIGSIGTPVVYVPKDGLVLAGTNDFDAELVVSLVDGEAVTTVFKSTIPMGSSVVLDGAGFQHGSTYDVQLTRGSLVERWRWKVVDQRLGAVIDENRAAIFKLPLEAQQQKYMEAMLYEQLKLRTNMALVLQLLK